MKIWIAESEQTLRALLSPDGTGGAEAGDVLVIDKQIRLTGDLTAAVPVTLLFSGVSAGLDIGGFTLKSGFPSAGAGQGPALKIMRL